MRADTASAADLRLLAWLKQHGAEHEKVRPPPPPRPRSLTLLHLMMRPLANTLQIDWPSTATVGGVRGAVAKEAIATNEHIMTIPRVLMMTPLAALESPELGPVFRDHGKIFVGA